MKAMFKKVLRLLGLDVLILGLVEKLALGLIKKLTSLQTVATNYLDRVLPSRNGSQTDDR